MEKNNLFDLHVNTSTGIGKGLPVRPLDNMVNIKHDGRTGEINLLLPTEETKARGSRVVVNAVSFIPLTTLAMVAAKNVSSNLSISGVFDVYQYENNRGKSIGIFDREGAYEKINAKSKYRIFGFITGINGKDVANSGTVLADLYGNQVIPSFMDLTYQKWSSLQSNEKNTGHYEGNLITVVAGRNDENIQEVTLPNSQSITYYLPNFTINTLTTKNQKDLAAYAKNYVDVVMEYIEKVREHDKFLLELQNNLLVFPDVVNKLRGKGIQDYSSLMEYVDNLENGDRDKGFAKLATILSVNNATEVNTYQATTIAQPELIATNQQMQQQMIQQLQKMQQMQQKFQQNQQMNPMQAQKNTIFPNNAFTSTENQDAMLGQIANQNVDQSYQNYGNLAMPF